MNLLEKMRDLITPGDEEEELITAEGLGERRSEVREEISRLEDRLRVLRSGDGRREALAEAEEPEDLGRRKRLLQDRIDGLEDLAGELLRRQREAENEEMRRTLHSTVEGLPEAADELEEALAALRDARSRFEEVLGEAVRANSTLEVRDLDPTAGLPEAQARRVERLAEEHLSGAYTLGFLYPPDDEEGESERRVVEDVQHQIRYLVGDWSDVPDWRDRVPPAPAGWTNDFSRATGISK